MNGQGLTQPCGGNLMTTIEFGRGGTFSRIQTNLATRLLLRIFPLSPSYIL
jgi:hypothetical protein